MFRVEVFLRGCFSVGCERCEGLWVPVGPVHGSYDVAWAWERSQSIALPTRIV